MRAEAIELLACLASQPEHGIPSLSWTWCTSNLPGEWSLEARAFALDTVNPVMREEQSYFRDDYAEAEARLREAARAP